MTPRFLVLLPVSVLMMLPAAACDRFTGRGLAVSRNPDGKLLIDASSLNQVMSADGMFLPDPAPDISPMKPDIEARFHPQWFGIERLETIPGRPRRAFRIFTNSQGFRTREFRLKKPLEVFRVVLLGDSTAYGIPVEPDETFAVVLEAELLRRHPYRQIEVINLGIPGYLLNRIEDLYQGLSDLESDIVMIASAFNDLGVKPLEMRSHLPDLSVTPAHLWRVRLPGASTADMKLAPAGNLDSVFDGTFRRFGPWRWAPFTSRAEYAELMARLVDLVRQRGALPVFIDGEFSRRYYRPVRERMAHELDVPVFPAADLLVNQEIELSSQRDPVASVCPYAPSVPASEQAKLRMRVMAPPGLKGGKGFRLAIQRLGMDTFKSVQQAPWLVPPYSMRDDGRAGDDQAGDGIFSLMLDVPVGETLRFFFIREEAVPRFWPVTLHEDWTARFFHTFPADLSRYRRSCDPEDVYTSPVYVYGYWDLMSEPVHPNAAGHRVIGLGLADYLEQIPEVRARLENPE
ncbi:MAG: hypothetical protein KIT79_01650 [Deltaproteobacteria bacterium]|nr:hypothetical protein [Deltaproteobacteria bacterium]